MSGRKTSNINQFQKSVGAGFQSLVGAKGRTFFLLEIKSPTPNYAVGKTVTFTSDYVELGRDAKAALSFASEFVSRSHAAIQKEGERYLLKNLSTTNPTLINGQPIAKQFYLKNGDEIQLSKEGPKIGFLTPANNVTKSLPLSVRFNAFKREAIKPYRNALMGMTAVFILAFTGLSFMLYNVEKENQILAETIKEIEGNINIDQKTMKDLITDLKKANNKLEKEIRAIKVKNTSNVSPPKKVIPSNTSKPPVAPSPPSTVPSSKPNTPPVATPPAATMEEDKGEIINKNNSDVYLIGVEKMVFTAQLPKEELAAYNKKFFQNVKWFGTGFLMANGQFITARHVVHPWLFLNGQKDPNLIRNILLHNLPGAKITTHFIAISPAGKQFKFTSEQVNVNNADIKTISREMKKGEVVNLKIMKSYKTDWAALSTTEKGSIKFNATLSSNLTAGKKVYFLGYPRPQLTADMKNLKPTYSDSSIGQSGLTNGLINITNRGFDHGNSGGPAFVIENGEAYAIGIVSSGIGSSLGFLVPITSEIISN